MFRRPQHRSVLAVLSAFRADLLSRCRFLFGGGTRIVLDLDEYRESHDIDFLCSDPSGYADLRLAASQQSYQGLFKAESLETLSFPREIRVDQYGIRFSVVLAGEALKVELIREARISLEPATQPEWSPVGCLSLVDCYAEKLLANSDRWADRQVFSRDLIDLAALRARVGPIPEPAWSKAEAAYRSAPRTDLRKALSVFAEDSGYRHRCLEGLRIEEPSLILNGLSLLGQDSGSS